LSGGLDSSAIAALVRPHVPELHTFTVGMPGSADVEAARLVARHLGTIHHEHLLSLDEVRAHLPQIVYALESYDQDLVRSAVPTFFTARLAARHVKVVLTGEGADELFAGYAYHRHIHEPDVLQAELRRSVGALHNINLQRVDRMTMAHSLEARVPFLDPHLIEVALAVPPELKLARTGPEKRILRQAVADLLPAEVVWRDKAQFDEGSGAADLLAAMFAGDDLGSDRGLDRYRARHPDAELRSVEECRYHQLLLAAFADPAPLMGNVGRWAHRPAGLDHRREPPIA
ncbi:MAG: asparagine synthase-related protein, partial [Acidimicrobiia bacterium]